MVVHHINEYRSGVRRLRDIKTLQTFTSVQASIDNHFNHQRHLNRRDIFNQSRAAALVEWRQLAV